MPFRLKRPRPANHRVKDSTPPTSSRSDGSDFSDSSGQPRSSKRRRSSRLAKMGSALSRHHHSAPLVKVASAAPIPPDSLVMLTEALLRDAKELQANGVHDDKDTKKKITMKAKKIFQEVAGADDIVGGYAVAMGEIGATYIFMHWKLFDKIPDEGSVSFKELADAIDAEESLIARIGGMLVSVGRLAYAGPGRVGHSKTSQMFRSNQHAGNLFRVMFEHGLRGYTHWPDYFTTYGPKEPTHVTHNPFTYGWGHPEKTVWDVVAIDEERATVFASGMKSLNTISGKHNGPSSIYDFSWLGAEAKTGSDKTRTLLVDVGGSHGHTLKHILEAVPALPAERCVLQDLPDVIDQAIREDEPVLRGVKKIGHDFNKEQPVKGALTYMLRRVLHDYGDDACIKILSCLADALDPSEPRARVLIMDQIVSDPPTPRNAAADMVMLNIGGKERTPADFAKIASESGLKVVKIHRIEGTEVGVVECAKA